MSSPSSETKRPIVHIRPARFEEGAGGLAERLLADLSAEVEVCGDVYRGLARLLRRDGGPPQAVVVCVEDLGPAEMEFFSITARLLRDTPVYVYGAARLAERVRRAIELGAAGEATEEVIGHLNVRGEAAGEQAAVTTSSQRGSDDRPVETAKRRNVEVSTAIARERLRSDEGNIETGEGTRRSDQATLDTPRQGQAPRRSDQGAEAVAAVAVVPAGGELPAAQAPAADLAIGEVPREPIREPGRTESSRTGTVGDESTGDGLGEDLSASVGDEEPAGPSGDEGDARAGAGRVPWLRYGDRPVRRPPPRFEDDQARSVREVGKRPAALRGPLLTEEELRALIGDDIASIAPEHLDESAGEESSGKEQPP